MVNSTAHMQSTSAMLKKTRLPINLRLITHECNTSLTFLFLWPWPWFDDRDIRTCFNYSEDVLAWQDEVSRPRLSKVRHEQDRQTYRHTHTHTQIDRQTRRAGRCDRTHYHATFTRIIVLSVFYVVILSRPVLR